MGCKFEQDKKERRIEIPSPLRIRDVLGHAFIFYTNWCVVSLISSAVRVAQGFESVEYVAALAGSIGCTPLYVLLCWQDTPVKDWRRFLRDYILFLVIAAIMAVIYCLIWRDPMDYWEVPPILWLLSACTIAMATTMSIMHLGYRDDLRLHDGDIEVVRSWPLNLHVQVFRFERDHYDVELVYRTWEGRTGPPGLPLDCVLLFDGGRKIQLGLMQSEEDLRRIYELLLPEDVMASGEGIWEFSDRYLRHASKV